VVPVKNSICGTLILMLAAWLGFLATPGIAPAQDLPKMEQLLKEAAELQAARPQGVAEKLAPMLAELRELRQGGKLTPEASKLLQDALLLQMRTMTMLLLPEAEIASLFRELLVTNPRIEETVFNPREKLLFTKLKSTETGHYLLQSTPPGAVLSYLGAEFGNTPLSVALIGGTYHFQLRLPGHLDQDFEVTIRAAEDTSDSRSLRRRTVEIPIATSAPGASVILNGEIRGVSQAYNAWIASLPADRQQDLAAIVQPWNADKSGAGFFRLAEVPVGEPLRIEFQAACYQPVTLQLTVNDQEVDWAKPVVVRPEFRMVELKRDTGYMEVSSAPASAEVFLDGVLQGLTPLGKDVCVGSHRVQVIHRSGQYVQEVTIRRGQAVKVSGDLKPALVFLGIYERNTQTKQVAPAAESEAAARRIALRTAAFSDPRIAPEEIEALRKKGALPIEQLLQDNLETASADMLIKRISAAVGRADLLLLGTRQENRFFLRLYNTMHPAADLIELPALDEPALDFLVAQLNQAEAARERLLMPDPGMELMDSPRGLSVLAVSPAGNAAKVGVSPSALVKTVDQKPMTFREYQALLRAKKPGQAIVLGLQNRDAAANVTVPVRFSGAEYPWSAPDGFPNAVLAILRHLAERDPLSEEAKYAGLGIARAFMNQKEWRLALESLAKTSLEPNKSGVCPGTVLYYQGRCYEELGDRAQAESYYMRARDYAEATLGMPGGPPVPPLAEQRIQSLKKGIK